MSSFIEMWNRFQNEERSRKAIDAASNDELQKLWDGWDGTELMRINSVYVSEGEVYFEMQKRGLNTTRAGV